MKNIHNLETNRMNRGRKNKVTGTEKKVTRKVTRKKIE